MNRRTFLNHEWIRLRWGCGETRRDRQSYRGQATNECELKSVYSCPLASIRGSSQDWLATGARGYVPTLWHLEIANVLWACERRKRIKEADSTQFLAVLAALNIVTDDQTEQHAGQTTLSVARRHGLSVYDAAYLELTMRLGFPLGSKDDLLRKVARAVGISVLPAED